MRRARDIVTDQLLGKGAAARLTQLARHRTSPHHPAPITNTSTTPEA